jgi:cell fate (sporulation/competence/biofilm development) regulator YmcA (YheA/YmcA/DUF963 family)
MAENQEITLRSLEKNIKYIISKYESEHAEKIDLKTKLNICKDNLEKSNNKIKELEQRIDNLQLIEAFKTSSADVKEAKQNIGKLIREIDKCISLLND